MKNQENYSSKELRQKLEESCRPKFYPSIVLNFNTGPYCYFPVYLSSYNGGVKEDESSIIGKYRDLVVNPERIDDEDFVLNALLKITAQEAIHHQCRACLCLSPEKAVYYIPETGKFDGRKFVPWHTHWLSDEEYKTLKIYDLDSRGKRYVREIEKSMSRQYYFLAK